MSAFSSTSAILVRSDVLEVGDSAVADVAIFVVEFEALGSWSYPSFGDEDVAVRSSDEVAHPRVVGMDVGFGVEVLGAIVLHLIQSSGREGEEDTHRGTIEFRVPLSWYCAYTKAEFCAVREIDFLRGR